MMQVPAWLPRGGNGEVPTRVIRISSGSSVSNNG